MKSLTKKGFKGNESDAEKVLKQILLEKEPLLYNNVWITSEPGMLVANMLDKNLKTPSINLIKKELLNKKRMKYWMKKVKG